MAIETLAAMAAALAILALTPGPGVFAVVGRAIGHGFADTAAMVGGIVLGDLVYFTAALTGWAAVAEAFGDVFGIVRLVAAAALAVMGGRMILASFRHAPATARTPVKGRAFAAGFLLTLGNPKAILFYLAFLPTFIDLTRIDAVGAAEVAAVIVVVVGGVLLAYAAAAARAAACLSRPAFSRWMQRGAGAILIGTGAAVAGRG